MQDKINELRSLGSSEARAEIKRIDEQIMSHKAPSRITGSIVDGG